MEHEIDAWIEQLSQCKQLSEADVKRLCDKVRVRWNKGLELPGRPCTPFGRAHAQVNRNADSCLLDTRNSDGGEQCAASEVPSDGLW